MTIFKQAASLNLQGRIFLRSGCRYVFIRLWWPFFWALAIISLSSGFGVMAEEIKIGGTGNALGTMRLLGIAFNREHPDIQVRVLNSIGSSGAIKAVPKGAIDIGLSSRPFSDEEGAAGVAVNEYARTLTVLAVAAKSQVKTISREQIADIYSGNYHLWPDGTPIRPVLRKQGDDNTRQLRALSPAIEQALEKANNRQGLPFAVTDQEAAEKIESIPGAIGVTTLALILSEGRALHPLTLDGIEPNVEKGISGSYPIIKHFFMLTQPQPSAAVQEFMVFLHSPVGRDILIQNGHWLP
ncbi:MAG: substrate-binding domain-containing protein [Candidatus Sumerlaeaceae bacterium]|nr:substrate-binding domain-containing protein [Candidatus Sumerlaeaceae bacterium]